MANSWGDVKPICPDSAARAARLSLMTLVLATASATHGEVTGNVSFDTTIGSAPGSARPNDTYDWVIDPSRGETRGRNLFFSFSDFHIAANENAGLLANGIDIDNAVLRVPNSTAQIDGTLTSTIPEANVFLLAPQGLVFGATAELNVSASLYLSTANGLVFEDGRFDTLESDPWSGESCCKGTAVAVHFEGVPDPGTEIPKIIFGSGQSRPIFPADGYTLFASAGQVDINNSQLSSDLGTIYISATGRAGTTVPLVDTDAGWLADPGVDADAKILIEGSTLTTSPSTPGGRVVLRGGELVITNTILGDGSSVASTLSAGGEYPHPDRPAIEAQATHTLEVRSGSLLIASNSETAGNPGIRLKAPLMTIEGNAALFSRGGSKIEMRAGHLGLVDHASVLTVQGGDIDIHAASLEARNLATIVTASAPLSNAGNIQIAANVLKLENGSRIRSSAEGKESSGNINIQVDGTLSITGVVKNDNGPPIPAGILARSGELDNTTEGSAGNIDLSVGSLDVSEGGLVSARSYGPGRAGSISIQASGAVTLEGISERLESEISVRNVHGEAGDITLNAHSLSIRDTATIAANSEGPAPAGNILLDVKGDFLLAEATVSAISLESDRGGDIEINAGGHVAVQDGQIETNVRKGSGSGGNIYIGNTQIPRLAVLNGSTITAQAAEGQGGNIQIRAETLLTSADSVLDASSELGVDGSLEVEAPVVQVAGRLDPLPASFLDVRALLRAHCAQRAAEGGSSFTIEEGPPPPPSPRGYLPSPPRSPSNTQTRESETVPSMSRQLEQFDEGCGRDLRLARAP